MAITKLNCPECGTVLRPARPVTAGKKVKCPKCELVFVAGEDEEEAPRKAANKPAKAKQAAPAAKAKETPKKDDDDEEGGTYGYVKDPEEEEGEEEKKKKKINYAPDESVRDLRGPAIVKLTGPGGRLQLVGMAGVLGWMILFLLLLIPTLFPILPDPGKPAPVMAFGPALGAVNPTVGSALLAAPAPAPKGDSGPKIEDEKGGFFELMGFDLAVWFLMLMVPLMLLIFYSMLVVAGGIKMVNLESRAFAFVSSIMAMLPMHIAGLAIVFSLLANYLCVSFLEDAAMGEYIGMVVSGLMYLASLGTGIWCILVLMDQEVIDGFAFDPE